MPPTTAGSLCLNDKPETGYSNRLLALGAALGVILAATGLVEEQLSPVEQSVIATVDGEAIYLSQYQRYLETLASDRRDALDQDDRTHILDRLIDEKLLIRHGEVSGVTRTEPAVRKAIVDAVIDNIISAGKGVVPSEAELARFYDENRAYFSHSPRLRVQRMAFRGEDARQRADRAHSALVRGEAFDAVKADVASSEVLTLPATALPANRLPNYLGPSLSAVVADLAEGEFTQPLESGDSLVILRLAGKLPGNSPELAEIRDAVLREYQRRANDEALREYLADLRSGSDIRINHEQLTLPDTGNRQ